MNRIKRHFQRKNAKTQRRTQRFRIEALRLCAFALKTLLCISLAIITFLPVHSVAQQSYDLVILNGRVIDPESKTDSIRNLGISNGTIKTISPRRLAGRTVIDAHGLVVSPGFIDLQDLCSLTDVILLL